MPLGLSMGELALIAAVGMATFGPKEIPVIARAAGRLTGRAVKNLRAARDQLNSFVERNELNELHREVKEAMGQLERIREEIRSGAYILRQTEPSSSAHSVHRHGGEEMVSRHGGKEMGSRHGGGATNLDNRDVCHMQHEAVQGPLAGRADPSGTGSNLRNTRLPESLMGRHHQGTPPLPLGLEMPLHGKEKLERDMQRGENHDISSRPASCVASSNASPSWVIPVSAVEAGLVPSRKGGPCCGSEVLIDCFVERDVALKAKRFLQSEVPTQRDV